MNGIYLYENKHRESYAIETHHHANYQILYAIEGNGSISLNGRMQPFEQDHAVVILPFSKHAVSSDSHLTLLVLAFDEGAIKPFLPPGWKEQFLADSLLIKLHSISSGELRLLLRKLLFEFSRQERFSEWAINLLLQEVLLLLTRVNQTPQMLDANGIRAERIRNYIDTHYYEPLTSGDPAFKMGSGSRHASNIFKNRYQMTPMQYLAQVRIGIACKLLTETGKDIVSICFEIGYESLPTFYRAFKNRMNMSPNQFRQQHQSPIPE